MEDNEAIYQLFQYDRELDKYYAQIHRLSNDEECEKLTQQLEKEKANLKELETELTDAKKQMKKEEMETETCHQEKKELNQKLYSGTITDAKEMEDVWAKIDSLKKKEQDAFEKYCHLMEQVESLNEAVGRKKKELESLQSKLENKQQENEKKIQELKEVVNQQEAQKKKVESHINETLLQNYWHLRKRFPLDTVVLLDGKTDVCACGLSLPTEAHNRLMVEGLRNCHNCGRILVCFD